MGFFPFFIDIADKKCVVAGGGKVASGKIKKLMMFGPEITVISPEISSDIPVDEKIKIIKRKFCDDDIEDAFMVICATDDRDLNAHISDLCRKKNIPVNTVDIPELCSFYFPALVRNENLTVGISTEGKSPLAASYLRKRISEITDDSFSETVEILGRYREYVRQNFSEESQRKEVYSRIFDLCMSSGNDLPDDEKIKKMIGSLRCEYDN